MTNTSNSAILLIHCPDKQGIVAAVSGFLFRHNGNVVYLDQHVDQREGVFFMRIEWELHNFDIPADQIATEIERLATEFQFRWRLYFTGKKPRMALMVSKMPHCLYDLLARWKSGEYIIDVPLIISNHNDLSDIARQFNIPFYHIPVTKENKQAAEEETLALLKKHQVSFIVLARYMQILSAEFIAQYPEKVINIHHSFLPAFPGAKPYHSAWERGVKVMGATSHYVTPELDAGPIIEQDVTRITHNDDVNDLIRRGRDIEKVVLARAVYAHIHRKVLVYKNRTIVFA